MVHENHGVGQFMGVVRLASEGTYRDFLHIRYQGTDKLYVPTDQLDRVQKYIGSEGENPKLNRQKEICAQYLMIYYFKNSNDEECLKYLETVIILNPNNRVANQIMQFLM